MKKKSIITSLCGCLVMACVLCGCGKDDGRTYGDKKDIGNVNSEKNDVENSEGNSEVVVSDVTLEEFLNHGVTDVTNFTYEISTDSNYSETEEACFITSYLGTDPVVVIPDEIEGYPVISFLDTFSKGNGKNVVALKCGNSIYQINGYSFMSMSESAKQDEDSWKPGSLKYFVGGQGLATINDAAFDGCKQLEYIKLVNSVDYVSGLSFPIPYGNCDVYLSDDMSDFSLASFQGMTIHSNSGSKASDYLNSIATDEFDMWGIKVVVE